MLGILRTSHKSSARRPDRYRCRVMGADSTLGVFCLPLSGGWLSVFLLHTNACGVPVCGGVGDADLLLPIPGELRWGKLMSLGCSSGMGLFSMTWAVVEAVGVVGLIVLAGLEVSATIGVWFSMTGSWVGGSGAPSFLGHVSSLLGNWVARC